VITQARRACGLVEQVNAKINLVEADTRPAKVSWSRLSEAEAESEDERRWRYNPDYVDGPAEFEASAHSDQESEYSDCECWSNGVCAISAKYPDDKSGHSLAFQRFLDEFKCKC